MSKQIQHAVSAIFALNKADELSDLVVTPYEFGIDAVQDNRAANSAYFISGRAVISLQKVEDKALQDAPQEGSLEGNDNGATDERELERLDLLEKAALTVAILERACVSLEEKARKETEHVGHKSQDGSRLRFNLNYGSKAFKGYHMEWPEFVLFMRGDAPEGSVWAMKCDAALEQRFPLIDATQAMFALPKLFCEDELETLSDKTWGKLISSFTQYGEVLAAHNLATIKFNAGTKDDTAKSLFDKQCKEFRRATRDATYWVNRHMEPVSLLAVTGLPSYLTSSVYWRTEVAKLKAVEAECMAMEAEASAQEAMAKVLQTKATMKLMDAIELQDQAEADLAAMRAALKSRRESRENTDKPVDVITKPAAQSLMPRIVATGPVRR